MNRRVALITILGGAAIIVTMIAVDRSRPKPIVTQVTRYTPSAVPDETPEFAPAPVPSTQLTAPSVVSDPQSPSVAVNAPTAASKTPAAVALPQKSFNRASSETAKPNADRGDEEPLIPEPVARMALAGVGADPQAEDVWETAINDPSLDPKARQDLIEDLNEDGFPDPKHITPADLPLILSRMNLIEQLAPAAMDDVNAAAFQEAYKDLVNMLRPFVAAQE